MSTQLPPSNVPDNVQGVLKQLIEARKQAKLSKKAMAKILGIDRRTYDRIEQGKAYYSDIVAMAHYLGFKLLLLPKHYFDR